MLTDMIIRLFFKRLSAVRQANYMKRRGIVVGTRSREGRMSYLYMVNNLFAEILYENDNPALRAETVVVMEGLQNLTRHLEKDLRESAFPVR